MRCFAAYQPYQSLEFQGSSIVTIHSRGLVRNRVVALGIEASPSFVREPEGNGVAERFIRTLKENLLWVRTFKTVEELRAALVASAKRYNETWLVARHRYKTPAKVREEQTMPRLAIDLTPVAALPLAA
jgi:transposase InsO family protein